MATSTQSMYTDSGEDSGDDKMMLTIETMHNENEGDGEGKLIMIRPNNSTKMESELDS